MQVEDAIDAADAQAEYSTPCLIYNQSVVFSCCERYLQQKIAGAKAALPEVMEMNKQVRLEPQNETQNP